MFVADRLGSVAKQLLAAWSLLPKHEHVPYRGTFDPAAVARILPVITLLERVSEGEWRFRLIGSEVERRWGKPLTGLNCIEILEPDLAEIVCREFCEVVRQPCGSWSVRRVEYASGKCTRIETLRLPLRAKDGSVSLIVGSIGELTARVNSYQQNPHRSITAIAEQWFFDIGAGITTPSTLLGR